MKKYYPDWQKKKDQPPFYPFKAHTTSLSKLSSSIEEATNLKELAYSMSILDNEEKYQLFDILLKRDKNS
jgi:hypothetical protein